MPILVRKNWAERFSRMDVRHEDDDLARLEADPEHTGGRDNALVRKFRRVLNLIRGIKDETGIYKHPGLRYEKLQGKRQHQRSLRLTGGWRLIVEIEEHANGNCMVVKAIENYHR